MIKEFKTIEDFDRSGLLDGLSEIEKIEVGNYMRVINSILPHTKIYKTLRHDENDLSIYMFILPMFRRVYSMLLDTATPNILVFDDEELRKNVLASFDIYDFVEYVDRMWQFKDVLIFLRNSDYEA